MSGLPPRFTFGGFELVGACLRARFAVSDSDGRSFTAIADVRSDGSLSDLQASDHPEGGTTGRSEIDELIRRRVAAELVRARGVAAVEAFDRRHAGARSRYREARPERALSGAGGAGRAVPGRRATSR